MINHDSRWKKGSPKDQRMDVLDTYLEHGFGTRVNDALTGSLDFVEKAHGGFGLFGWEIDGKDEEDAKGKSRLCYYLFLIESKTNSAVRQKAKAAASRDMLLSRT